MIGILGSLLAIALVFTIMAAVAGFIVYWILYKKRINKRIESEEFENGDSYETTEKMKRYPDPEKILLIIGAVVAIVLIVFFVAKTAILSNEIEELEEKYDNIYLNIERNIMYEFDKIYDELEELENPFEEFYPVEYGNISEDMKEAEVKVRISVKKSSDVENVKLKYGDETYEMTDAGNGNYECSITVKLFEDNNMYAVMNVDGKETEKRLDGDAFTEKVLHIYYPQFTIKGNAEFSNEGKNVYFNGSFMFTVAYPENDEYAGRKITSAEFYVDIDGKNTIKKELSVQSENTLTFSKMPMGEYDSCEAEGYILAVDGEGYTYRIRLFNIDVSGEYDAEVMAFGEETYSNFTVIAPEDK